MKFGKLNWISTIVAPLTDSRFIWLFGLFLVLGLLFDIEGLGALRITIWIGLFWCIANTLRKILLPYIDKVDYVGDKRVIQYVRLSDYYKKSLETPLSASIAFAAVIYLICSIATSFIHWMH